MKKFLASVLVSSALLMVSSTVTSVEAATVSNDNVSALSVSNKVVVKVTNPNGGNIYSSNNSYISLENRAVKNGSEWIGIPVTVSLTDGTVVNCYKISTNEYILASDVTVVGMA